jgi:hypothetical protein
VRESAVRRNARREGRVLRFFARVLLALAAAWAGAALWFDSGASPHVAATLAIAVGAGGALAALALRPFTRAAGVGVLLVAVVAGWWLSIPARGDRDWLPDVARSPRTLRNGDHITIENVRDFRYRSETDYDEHWETREYDLSKLVAADLFLVHWGAPGIAHTIASWEFENAPPLAISIETRKEKGESYSAVRGFFRQYELYYVVADERDLIGVRASHRGEQVFLYRVRMPRDRARALLLRYLDEVDRLAAKPRWYNALTHNCTTEIRWNMQAIGERNPFDWRILANGHLDEAMYERGRIDTSLPFAELRARSDVTQRAKDADDAPDFSRRIREGVPGFTSG